MRLFTVFPDPGGRAARQPLRPVEPGDPRPAPLPQGHQHLRILPGEGTDLNTGIHVTGSGSRALGLG